MLEIPHTALLGALHSWEGTEQALRCYPARSYRRANKVVKHGLSPVHKKDKSISSSAGCQASLGFQFVATWEN